jgi:2-pyrone-4,6-dicarboxylate lactonase
MNTAAITWNPAPSRPRLRLPAGSVDTHCHVFGPAAVFPFDPNSRYLPGDAPKEQLFALHDMLGIDRRVIVQAGVHAFDNSVVADAIAARPVQTRGIALAPPDISAAGIARLSDQGFRGVRYNYISHLSPGASAQELRALGPRLADAGWQLVVHMEASVIEEMAPLLAAMPATVVIDHMGRVPATDGLSQAPFVALIRLMEKPHVWVKVSGCERTSAQDYPYSDAIPFARQLVEAFPDRVLWGTDWPHPNFRADPPDDGKLVDLLAEIAPDEDTLRRLMVTNPQRLYDFGPLAGG